MGICMASGWGVGRIIDALEQNRTAVLVRKKSWSPDVRPTGNRRWEQAYSNESRALRSGGSGCGGTCSWRVSSEYGHGNTNTDCQDITHLETNWTGTGYTDNTWAKGKVRRSIKLPFDQASYGVRAPGAMLQVETARNSTNALQQGQYRSGAAFIGSTRRWVSRIIRILPTGPGSRPSVGAAASPRI